MRLLGITIILIFIISICFHLSCSPGGALTPQDAFYQVQGACRNGDVHRLVFLLSDTSKKKIKIMVNHFTTMEVLQLQKIAKGYHLAVGKLQKMTTEDFLRFSLDASKKNNSVFTAAGQGIIGVKIEKNRAEIRVTNGMCLHFVRQGPYWKLSLDNL